MLQNAQLSRNINGVHTDVVLQTFSDRIIVLVTQVGKVGNLVSFSHLFPNSILFRIHVSICALIYPCDGG